MNSHVAPSPTRRKLFAPLTLITLLAAVCGVVIVSSMAQSAKEEREIEDKIPAHLPIKVKLRKPEKVKDLKNDEWLSDLEVEVTNTGAKPIYYLYIALMLPDVLTEDGKKIAYTLSYGRTQLYEPREQVQADDVPIMPGESAVLKVPVDRVSAWKAFRGKGRLSNPKKLEFWFQSLKFGDGTGYWTLDGIPFPRKKERANAVCGEGRVTFAKAVTDSPPKGFSPPTWAASFLPLPANFMPAIFFRADAPAKPIATADTCCPGGGNTCSHLRPKLLTCICGEVLGMESAPCSDPYGGCSTHEDARDTCTIAGLEYYCDRPIMGGPCNAPTPTPTPTPTPAPTPPCDPAARPHDDCKCNPDTGQWRCCDPNKKPNDTNCACNYDLLTFPPFWQCVCGFGDPADYTSHPSGCPTGTYNDGSDCCLPYAAGGGCDGPPGDSGPTDSGDTGPVGCHSPVLIDTSGDGLSLTDAAGGVLFDIDGDGRPERLSWTRPGSDDAWLALDRDGDGRVDDGRELFGNHTPQPASPAPNGFLALAEFDGAARGGNGDGTIDPADAVFARLRLWRDANHDGVSEAGELLTLPALGVARLHLDYKESMRVDEHGNRFRYRAKVDDARGAGVKRWAWDVFLAAAR